MKSMKLLEAMGEAKEEYVFSALESRSGSGEAVKQVSLKRTLLIAAVIVLTLLLVGCAVVYALHLEDFKIAAVDGYRRYDQDGKRTEKTETRFDVLSLHGTPDSPNQLAAKEWWEYRNTTEGDSLTETEKDPSIPDNLHYTYQCRTEEDVNALNGIAEKYNLKLLGVGMAVQQWQPEIYFTSMGISGICRAESEIQETVGSGVFYPEGDFDYSCELSLNTPGAWQHPIWTTFHYTGKDSFDPAYLQITTDDYEQWSYTTSYGTEVFLARSNLNAIIFAELEDAYITVLLSDALSRPLSESNFFTQRDIELAADGLNLQMHPKAFDPASIQPLLDAADAEEAKTQQEPEKADYSKYAGYRDFLLDYFHTYTLRSWKPFFYYALYDIDGNGVEELLLGRDAETFDFVLTQENGRTAEYLPELNRAQLCDGMRLYSQSADGYDAYQLSFSCFDAYSPDRDTNITELVLLEYSAAADAWTYSDGQVRRAPISAEEAALLRAEYAIVPIELQPILEYPMDDMGTTLGEYEKAQTLALRFDARMALYRETIENAKEITPSLQYFALSDLNGDGIDELLLSDESDIIRQMYTMFEGKVTDISIGMGHDTLCQGGILRYTGYDYISQEARYFSFYRLNSYCIERIETVELDQESGKWYVFHLADLVPKEIPEEEADSVLSKYVSADVPMQPLDAFPEK